MGPGLEPGRVLLKRVGTLVLSAVAVIVMIDEIVAPSARATFGVENEQPAPSGRPEQLNATVPAKPPVEVNETG
jgi:hypothetical protein